MLPSAYRTQSLFDGPARPSFMAYQKLTAYNSRFFFVCTYHIQFENSIPFNLLQLSLSITYIIPRFHNDYMDLNKRGLYHPNHGINYQSNKNASSVFEQLLEY